ncbi:MAG: RNA-protein complex protein Nop10 [Ignisphaera sp.]
MRWRIKKCAQCKLYTIKDICPKCGSKTSPPHPPRFSPEDKYVVYRVMIKYPELLIKFKDRHIKESA